MREVVRLATFRAWGYPLGQGCLRSGALRLLVSGRLTVGRPPAARLHGVETQWAIYFDAVAIGKQVSGRPFKPEDTSAQSFGRQAQCQSRLAGRQCIAKRTARWQLHVPVPDAVWKCTYNVNCKKVSRHTPAGRAG